MSFRPVGLFGSEDSVKTVPKTTVSVPTSLTSMLGEPCPSRMRCLLRSIVVKNRRFA